MLIFAYGKSGSLRAFTYRNGVECAVKRDSAACNQVQQLCFVINCLLENALWEYIVPYSNNRGLYDNLALLVFSYNCGHLAGQLGIDYAARQHLLANLIEILHHDNERFNEARFRLLAEHGRLPGSSAPL